jgi:lysophospholipase L1-like esterase
MKKFLLILFLPVLFLKCKENSSVNKLTIINLGVPGNTAEMLLSRINTVTNDKPNLVIIMVGTNDILQGNNTYYSFNGTLSEIIDQLKAKGESVMLLTPPPVKTWNKENFDIQRLDTLCDVIDSLSKNKSCYFVDVNKDISHIDTAVNNNLLYVADGIHPTAIGYQDIAGYINSYMKSNHITAAKIVCFGDSITYGSYVNGAGTSTGQTYPAVLLADLNSGKN